MSIPALRSFGRLGGASIVVAGLGVALVACHPPHEQDSEQKIDTATSFAAPSSASSTVSGSSSSAETPAAEADNSAATVVEGNVFFAGCLNTAPEQAPTIIPLSCQNNDAQVENIDWKDWNNVEAHGTGTLVKGTHHEDDVKVVLSEPISTPAGTIFNVLTVDDEPIDL